MRVTILHQAVPSDASPDERDVLVQVEAVQAALLRLGHSVEVAACTLDLQALKDRLVAAPLDCVFNLVESLGGTDSLQFLLPAVVESLGLRMTGSSAACIFTAGRKVDAKDLLRRRGLPTPSWATATGASEFVAGRYIVKPIAEHASLGMVDADVIDITGREHLPAVIRQKSEALGRVCFAEQFVEGREFNISLLDSPAGPVVLPAAEIRFVDFPPGKPRIVGSAAKWAEDSFEYHATLRSFDFPDEDSELLRRLGQLALESWTAMGVSGYARVDFRVDNSGNPWILEVNANPCLSPDAGFVAAAARGGIDFDHVVERILAAV